MKVEAMELAISNKHNPIIQHRKRVLGFVILFITTFLLSLAINFNPLLLISELPYLWAFINEIVPPNFSFVFKRPDVLLSIFSTLAMAFLGTLFGGATALVLALFAAKNVVENKWISKFFFSLLTLIRVIPSFVMLLIFLIIAGIGPFAGTLALFFATIGTFGKLFAESIEHVETDVLNSVKSTGAHKSTMDLLCHSTGSSSCHHR